MAKILTNQISLKWAVINLFLLTECNYYVIIKYY